MTPAATTLPGLTAHLLERVQQVRDNLGLPPEPADADTPFADLLDSMGLVEFVVAVAEDLGVPSAVVESCVGRHFGTVGQLAVALRASGVTVKEASELPRATPGPTFAAPPRQTPCWLGGVTAALPRAIQPAAELNETLERPAGWLENHAGIRQRRVWGDEDPLDAAAAAVRASLDQTGLLVEQVGALLVTSEAPPLLTGLGAALHHRLDLRPGTIALEIGGACTGFLAALWAGRAILHQVGVVVVVAVEAPGRWLRVGPGAAGEAAALFGDGAAACVLCEHPPSPESVPVADVVLGCDGRSASLLRVRAAAGGAEVHFEGEALAARAVRTMAEAVADLARQHGLTPAELEGVVAHGGNGRMPALLARALDLPADRVWSLAAAAGNLGSASLPAAWAARQPTPSGPVAWAAVGAGLTWAAALTGQG
jgi:3-oxoacyl-[acyl-carrier-protein] synthase III